MHTIPELIAEAKNFLGGTLFGAIIGWLIRLVGLRPDTMGEGIRRGVFAVGAAMLFTDFLVVIMFNMTGVPEDRLIIPVAGAVAYGGERLIEGAYLWGVKKARGES